MWSEAFLRVARHIGTERFKEFRIGAVKHFLPAHTIDHDEDDVFRLMYRRSLGRSGRTRCINRGNEHRSAQDARN